MRFRNSTAAAVCVLAAGLTLGGCETSSSSGPATGSSTGSSGGSSTGSSGGSSTGSSGGSSAGSSGGSSAGSSGGSSAGSSGGSAATPVANASSSAQAGSASSAAASQPGTQAGAARGTCQPGNLSFALGAKTKTSGSQTKQTVDLTNKGSSACTTHGFPGVDLVGVARGKQDYTWSLARQAGRYSKVRLKPGGTAHFNVIYLPTTSGNIDNITVTKMVITPPNDHTQAALAWSPFVLLQDKAKHPGTYISPIASGS
jgi:Protein of unknown function (DUF4232)